MHFQRRCKDNLTKDTHVQYLNLLEDKSNLPNVRTSTRTNPTSVPKNSANFTKERRKARSGVSIRKVFTEGKPHTSKINESPNASKKRRIACSGVSVLKPFDLKDSTKREFVSGHFEQKPVPHPCPPKARRRGTRLNFLWLLTFFQEKESNNSLQEGPPHKYCGGPSI
jgi:hypothetical protein